MLRAMSKKIERPRRVVRPSLTKLEVRLPSNMIHAVDLIAAEMVCPRAAALRALLARGLKAQSAAVR
jgi:hypothetical protein